MLLLDAMRFFVPLVGALLLLALWTRDARVRSVATVLMLSVATMAFNREPFFQKAHELVQIAMGLTLLRRPASALMPGPRAALAFLTVALMSLLFASIRNGIGPSISTAIVNVSAATIVTMALLTHAHNQARHEATLKAFGLFLFVTACSGLLQAIIEPGQRVSGISSFVNPFAYLTAIGFILVTHYYRGMPRIVMGGAMFAAVVFTDSRAALLMLATYIVIQIVRLRRANNALVPLIAMVAAVGAGAVALNALQDRITNGAVQSSDAEREVIYRAAEVGIREHPITGLGWRQFQMEFRTLSPRADWSDVLLRSDDVFRSRLRVETHNDFLSILVELGVPGALLVGLLFAMAAFSCLRAPPLAGFLFVASAIYSLTHNMANSLMFFYLSFFPLVAAQWVRQDVRTPAVLHRLWGAERSVMRETRSAEAPRL